MAMSPTSFDPAAGGGSLPSLTGKAGQFLKVNPGETGEEWAALSGGGDMLAANNLSEVTPATARTNLGLVIGTNVQAYDAELAAIAGLTSASDRLPYFTGSGSAALATFTTAGRNLIDDADTTAQRATLGLVIGTDVQAQNANLAALAGLTTAADKLTYWTGSGAAATANITASGRALVAATGLATKGDLLSFSSVPGVLGVGSDNQVLTADSTATFGVKWAAAAGTSSSTLSDSLTATAGVVMTYIHNTSGTSAAGFGNEILHQLQDASGNTAENAVALRTVWTSATNGSESSGFRIGLRLSGAAIPAAGAETYRFDNGFATINGFEITTGANVDTHSGQILVSGSSTAAAPVIKARTAAVGVQFISDTAAGALVASSGKLIEWSNISATPKLGFYGVTAVARAATPTVLADVITILQNLGLCS